METLRISSPCHGRKGPETVVVPVEFSDDDQRSLAKILLSLEITDQQASYLAFSLCSYTEEECWKPFIPQGRKHAAMIFIENLADASISHYYLSD